jgi:hypothetical protein
VTLVDTAIYYDSEPVNLPDNRVERGAHLITMVFRSGWVSPNHMLGKHWSRTRKFRLKLDEQAKMHFLALPPEEREQVRITEPKRRVAIISIVQRRGPFPDVDNLLGGLKHLIDALKLRRGTKQIIEQADGTQRQKLTYDETGNPWIWDDSPRHFQVAEVHVSRQSSYVNTEPGNYVVVDLYEDVD